MHKVNISDCGNYFADRDGMRRFRLEYRCSISSGVEYFSTLKDVIEFEATARTLYPGYELEMLLETPESYESRLAAHDVLESRSREAVDRLGVALHLLESIRVTSSRKV